MSQRFTDEQLSAAREARTDPQRVHPIERRGASPRGFIFVCGAAGVAALEDPAERLTRFRTLLAEETRIGMLVGVAVGWELARELG